jgi:hypothetical protein
LDDIADMSENDARYSGEGAEYLGADQLPGELDDID